MTSEVLLAVTTPLVTALGVLGVLRRGSERALVLPTPAMMWLVHLSQRDTTAPWYAMAIAHAAVLILLVACWQQRRALAQWAVLGSSAAAVWLTLSHT